MNKLSIIIPVYNEEAFISHVIEKIYDTNFIDIFESFEVIVVDDGSSDNSAQIIKQLAGNYTNLAFYQIENNCGKGAAIKTGLKYAQGNLFIVQDSDLELFPDDILSLGTFLHTNNLEMVNGSRFLMNRRHETNSSMRNFANMLFSLIISVISGKRITDLTCGYKLFTRNFYEKIHLKEERFGIEAELLTKAIKFNKNKVKEFPVSYFPREISGGKKIRFIDGFRIIWACLKYRFVD